MFVRTVEATGYGIRAVYAAVPLVPQLLDQRKYFMYVPSRESRDRDFRRMRAGEPRGPYLTMVHWAVARENACKFDRQIGRMPNR
jgi:hypothetical protein